MKSKSFGILTILVSTCLLVAATADSVYSQVVRTGFKAGAQFYWSSLDDKGFRDTVSTSPAPGFALGAVASFKVKDRYFLHTEYLYSQRTKIVKGKVDPQLHDKTVYHFINIPALFTMHFKGKLFNDREFKWYLGAGPDVNYMLAARGVVKGGDLVDNGFDSWDYKVRFTERLDRDKPHEVHYNDVGNRFLFGLNVGTGLVLEPGGAHKIMLDVRYSFDHTQLGKGKADYLVPTDYNDDLRVRMKGVKFSVIYLFETNLSKQERNKGKSTIKR